MYIFRVWYLHCYWFFFLVSGRKKRWWGEVPKITDFITELMVKNQQFISYIFFPCQSVHKCSWNEETGTPSNFSLSSKRRAVPGKFYIYFIRKINANKCDASISFPVFPPPPRFPRTLRANSNSNPKIKLKIYIFI